MVFGCFGGGPGIYWLSGGDRSFGGALHRCYRHINHHDLAGEHSLADLLERKSEIGGFSSWDRCFQGPSVL